MSRHFPSVPDLLDNMYDLMRAIEVSDLHKSRLYKHFLKCADFAVNFISSNDFYQFARRLDTNREVCQEKTLDKAVQENDFLSR